MLKLHLYMDNFQVLQKFKQIKNKSNNNNNKKKLSVGENMGAEKAF